MTTRGELISTELFHSENDPQETVNISSDKKLIEVVVRLSKQLARGWHKTL